MRQQMNKQGLVLAKKRRKKTKTNSPQLQTFNVLHIQNCITKLPHNKLTIK